jgi:hypothetical protein
MDAIKDGDRVLQVKTQRHDRDEIVVAVEDSGPGIDPKKLDGIFDPFVSTKPQGMGLGLAICRMIIDRHGGQLSAWLVTSLFQSLAEGGQEPGISHRRCAIQEPNHWYCRLLRARHRRPRGDGTTNQRDELPPLHSITSSMME